MSTGGQSTVQLAPRKESCVSKQAWTTTAVGTARKNGTIIVVARGGSTTARVMQRELHAEADTLCRKRDEHQQPHKTKSQSPPLEAVGLF